MRGTLDIPYTTVWEMSRRLSAEWDGLHVALSSLCELLLHELLQFLLAPKLCYRCQPPGTPYLVESTVHTLSPAN